MLNTTKTLSKHFTHSVLKFDARHQCATYPYNENEKSKIFNTYICEILWFIKKVFLLSLIQGRIEAHKM